MRVVKRCRAIVWRGLLSWYSESPQASSISSENRNATTSHSTVNLFSNFTARGQLYRATVSPLVHYATFRSHFVLCGRCIDATNNPVTTRCILFCRPTEGLVVSLSDCTNHKVTQTFCYDRTSLQVTHINCRPNVCAVVWLSHERVALIM